MFIAEITQRQTRQIDEGILDNFKRGVQSAKQTAKNVGGDKGTTVSQEYKIQQMAGRAQAVWNGYVKQYAGSLDPEERQDYLSGRDGQQHKQFVRFVEDNLLGGRDINDFMNAPQINATIKQIISTSENTKPQAPETQPTPTSQNKKEVRHVSPSGTEVVSGEPRILKRQGKEYIRGDDGRWTDFRTSKRLPEPQQTFLDNEDEYFDTLNEDIASGNPQRDLFVKLIRQTSLAISTTSRGRGSRRNTYPEPTVQDAGSVRSTGNRQADDVLVRAGFDVQ